MSDYSFGSDFEDVIIEHYMKRRRINQLAIMRLMLSRQLQYKKDDASIRSVAVHGKRKQQEEGSEEVEDGSEPSSATSKKRRESNSALDSIQKQMEQNSKNMADALKLEAEIRRDIEDRKFMLSDVRHITDPVVLEYISIRRKEVMDRLKNKQ